MSNLKITKEKQLEICNKFSAGLSTKILATTYNVTVDCIRNVLVKNNVYEVTHELSKSDIKFIQEKYSEGVSAKELAELYGVVPGTVTYHIRKTNIARHTTKKALTKEQTLLAKSLYDNGNSSREIAKILKVSPSAVLSHIRQVGGKIRTIKECRALKPCIKHVVNENAFDNYHDEYVAYWLGMIMSDGNVYHPKIGSKRLFFGLQNRDKNHVERLRDFICPSLPVLNHKRTNLALFIVTSNVLVEKLNQYNIIQRKSLVAKAPECLENNRHFWRGYVDGNGWIGVLIDNKTGKEYYRLQLVGSNTIVNQFHCYLKRNIPGIKSHVGRKLNISRVCYANKITCKALNLLYSFNNVSLDRKQKKVNYIRDNYHDIA